MADVVSDPLRDRFRGALVGVAVGDALGAPFEGAPAGAVDAVQLGSGSEGEGGELRWTDDTAMTIVLAEELAEHGDIDGHRLAHAFREAYEAEPWRGYGAGPPRIFALLAEGAEWDAPARELFGGVGSFGNGAAMRAAPAGLAGHPDPSVAADLARRQAVITHAHPLGVDGAGVLAAAVSLALSHSLPFEPEAWLAELPGWAGSLDMRERLEEVRALLPGAPAEVVVDRLGHGIEALEAVPAALACVALNPHSFEDAVGFAVALGGDTDTIAAMAGAVAGALHGESGIPEHWRSAVEATDRLATLADRLHARR